MALLVLTLSKLSDKKIVNTNLVAKLIVVLLLLQPTVTEIISGINNTRLYNVLENNEEKFSNLIYLFGINTMQDSKSNEGAKYMEYRSKMLNYFNEHGGYFQVFDYEDASTIMSEEIPELIQLPFPYLEVNNNYILDYELLDENGNKVDINQLDDEALLVPLTYKDEDLSMYIGTQIIYIQEGYEFYRHDVPISYDTYIKYNPIIKVYKEIPFDNNFSSSPIAVQLPIRSKKDIDNLETYLIDEGLKDKVHFGSFQKDYEIIRQKTINQLQQTLIMVIIQLFAIFMFVFETIYLIIYQEKKLYALRYLNGENFIERYGELFLMNLMIYVISLLFGLFIYQIEVIVLLIFLGVLTVFELIIIYIMVKRFEKKNIAATLKGE